MEYNVMHRSYSPCKGGRSISNSKTLHDLGRDIDNYVGTFSEYYPISLNNMDGGNSLTYIRKNWTSTGEFQHHIKLPGLRLSDACSHVGGKIQNQGGVKFNKQDLLRIANSMDETDTLEIINLNYISDIHYCKESIKKVVE